MPARKAQQKSRQIHAEFLTLPPPLASHPAAQAHISSGARMAARMAAVGGAWSSRRSRDADVAAQRDADTAHLSANPPARQSFSLHHI